MLRDNNVPPTPLSDRKSKVRVRWKTSWRWLSFCPSAAQVFDLVLQLKHGLILGTQVQIKAATNTESADCNYYSYIFLIN